MSTFFLELFFYLLTSPHQTRKTVLTASVIKKIVLHRTWE